MTSITTSRNTSLSNTPQPTAGGPNRVVTFQLQASADNLFDSAGLTEGNPRVIGSQGTGPILARPILGQSFTFSAQFKF